MSHWIFGYGSLIHRKSRDETMPTGSSIPVRVLDLARRWSFAETHCRMMALGVSVEATATCNGVLVEVSEVQLGAFDAREKGYERRPLDAGTVVSLDRHGVPRDPLWVYIPRTPCDPSPETPIVQSYVDVVLTGCFALGRPFAEEFVHTTAWAAPWFDDRLGPRYPAACGLCRSRGRSTICSSGPSRMHSHFVLPEPEGAFREFLRTDVTLVNLNETTGREVVQ